VGREQLRRNHAADAAEFSLKNGDPAAALAQLQEQVRGKPEDPKLRIFLFQLLCLVGKWDRALNQLSVAAGLDTSGAGDGAGLRRRRPLRGRSAPTSSKAASRR